jgi:cell division protease FtsH
MASKIDAEVKKIMDAAYKKAKGILRKHENVLNKVARALLEHETVRGPEYEKLLA